jgi:hypothetical protein
MRGFEMSYRKWATLSAYRMLAIILMLTVVSSLCSLVTGTFKPKVLVFECTPNGGHYTCRQSVEVPK